MSTCYKVHTKHCNHFSRTLKRLLKVHIRFQGPGIYTFTDCTNRHIPVPGKSCHTTGVYVPYSFGTVVWVLVLRLTTIGRTRQVEVFWDGTYRFWSLSEKNRKNNRLQRLLQRQYFLLSYLKTLSVGPAGGLNPWPITRQTSKWVSQLS